MIATFAIEIVLAAYTLFKYKLSELMVVVFSLLTMLGVFQLAEYNVCTSGSEIWSRLGYAAITTLPALGIHLFYLLSVNKSRKVVGASYAAMAIALSYFLASSDVFTGYRCAGNFVIFELSSLTTVLYSVYYFSLLAVAISLSIYWLFKHPKAKTKKQLITALVVGYGVFLVPTATVITIFPDSQAGIPSIMCGFAVIFALILAVYIAPRALTVKKK